jgi:uncharacterized DUF497 family protein
MGEIRFTWDLAKAKHNLRVHGIAFADAKRVFADPYVRTLENYIVDGEARSHAIGRLPSQRLVFVVFTDETEDESDIHIHIISARKAEAFEELIYAEQFQ